MIRTFVVLAALVAAQPLIRCGVALAADDSVSDAEMVFFETKVRPLLAEHCWSCHGPDEQKGDLRLDSLTAIHAGGESGAAIDSNDPPASLLLEAVRYESFEMPPTGKLKDQNIAILERWVELGAPWPGQSIDSTTIPMKGGPADKISDEDRQWWAFQPLTKPSIPQVNDAPESWKTNPIDAFILAAMRDQDLIPAPQADRTALARRLYLDLIGLPPTPEQMAKFLSDNSPEAYDRLIDELLDSPHYGERWARYWLDLVRYADSDGYRIDHYRPHAWRYRDYVIDSFNSDKPYDRFVQEQIAGDELFPGDPQALTATGFLRHWIYEYNSRDAHGQWSIILQDVTDTTGDVFLGMGMQCAKCHDHKFDPILQRDYYRLQAFFQAMLPVDLTVQAADQRKQHDAKLAKWESETAAIREQLEELEKQYRAGAVKTAVEKFPLEVQEIYYKPIDQQTPEERQISYLIQRQVEFEYERMDSKFKAEDKERILELRRELALFDLLKPEPLPIAMAVRDVGTEAPDTIMPKRSREPIAPGFLTLLDESEAAIDPIEDMPTTGRRAALAKWLTRPDNQLTTRVIANRIWQYHFGRGLAPNSSDFGRLGGEPTHPELLDWLAGYLVENGWSLKSLHRLIVTSAAYRQGSSHPQFASFETIDPANRYYWRGGTRRLDAEQIRDAVLAVAGQLNLKPGGEGGMPDSPRRTIYTRMMRNDRNPLLDVFDLPAFFASESSRNMTTTPVQSLMLLNSPQMLRYSEAVASRVSETAESSADAIKMLWKLAYARPPEPHELDAAEQFLAEQYRVILEGPKESQVHDYVIGKMAYRDGQAISILPQSEQPRLAVANRSELDVENFTVEAFLQPRSVYETGSVRTAVSKWSGKSGSRGWAFGITGKGSRRKPQTLVLQMWGKKLDGSFGEAAIFSDHHIEMNRPYYAAASVTLAKAASGDQQAEKGTVKFFLKDLSDDDEPLLMASLPHDIVGGFNNPLPLVIGGRGGDGSGVFDGLIDSVRLSKSSLDVNDLLFTGETVGEATVGYWRFESDPGIRRDSSPNALDLIDANNVSLASDPVMGAMVDLSHAVLNSNEFLYAP
jgi:hypothetical protein